MQCGDTTSTRTFLPLSGVVKSGSYYLEQLWTSIDIKFLGLGEDMSDHAVQTASELSIVAGKKGLNTGVRTPTLDKALLHISMHAVCSVWFLQYLNSIGM